MNMIYQGEYGIGTVTLVPVSSVTNHYADLGLLIGLVYIEITTIANVPSIHGFDCKTGTWTGIAQLFSITL